MRKVFALVATVAALAASIPADARGPRGGKVVGPDGVLYDTSSPEWKASGGNMAVYEQIMQQKMMMLQQQYMARQQEAYLKQQKQQSKGKAGFNGSTLNGGIGYGTPFVPNFGAPARKKKRRTYDPTHPVTSHAKPPTPADAPKAATPAAPPDTSKSASPGAAKNPAPAKGVRPES